MPVLENLQHSPQWTLYLGESNIIFTAGSILGEVFCNEWSEACGSICNLALINLDRVKQAVINHQCQKYQRQDVNNTGQESGQAATQSELQGAISQGQEAENQRG